MTESERIEREFASKHVADLQRALLFWMPGVDMRLSPELRDRAGDDAQLLTGYSGEFEKECWGNQMLDRLQAATDQGEK